MQRQPTLAYPAAQCVAGVYLFAICVLAAAHTGPKPVATRAVVTRLAPPPALKQKQQQKQQEQKPSEPGKERAKDEPVAAGGSNPPAQSRLREGFAQFAHLGQEAGPSSFTMLVSVGSPQWMEFMRAYGGELAFSPYAVSPGSSALLYSLRDRQFLEGYIPGSNIVREITGQTGPLAAVLAGARAAKAFAGSPRIFSTYPRDLYFAMLGKCRNDLRERGIQESSVASVRVRYRPTAGGDYDTEIEAVSYRSL